MLTGRSRSPARFYSLSYPFCYPLPVQLYSSLGSLFILFYAFIHTIIQSLSKIILFIGHGSAAQQARAQRAAGRAATRDAVAATAEGEVAAESPMQLANVVDNVDTVEESLLANAESPMQLAHGVDNVDTEEESLLANAVQAANAAAAREVANGVQDGPASRAAAAAARLARSSGESDTPLGRVFFRRCLNEARRAEIAVEAAEEAYHAMDNGVHIHPLFSAMFPPNDSGPV